MYFQSCPKGLCRCPSLCVKWNSPPPPTLHHSVSHFILPCRLNLDYFLYTRVELKLPKTKKKKKTKQECMQNILMLSVQFSARQPSAPTVNWWTPFSYLRTTSWHCFSSFWVTVALFVLCPFVKLFLNVYTWFSDCLFCTFKFIIKQFKLSPWCLEDHIV